MSWQASAIAKTIVSFSDGESLNPSEKCVLLLLAEYSNPETHLAYPSVATLAKFACMSARNCSKILSRLGERGILQVIPRKDKRGLSLPNLYKLCERTYPVTTDRGTPSLVTDYPVTTDRQTDIATTDIETDMGEETFVEANASTPPQTLFPEAEKTAPPPPSRGPADVIREHLFPYYLEAAGRGDYPLTPLRLKKGVERLRECLKRTHDPGKAVELFEQAIDGLTTDPWNRGDNPQKKKYLDWIDHLCKSAEMFDKRVEAGGVAA